MASLVVEAGDCEFHGRCGDCGRPLGSIRPDQSLGALAGAWDLHVNTGMCPTPAPEEH